MKKKIIINIAVNEPGIRYTTTRIVDKFSEWRFIDFSGKQIKFSGIESVSARNLDPGNEIEFKSMYQYVKKVGELSLSGNIRTLTFNNLPLFWLTPFAEKHPFKHWLFPLFFFRSFLDFKRPSYFDANDQVIILTECNAHLVRYYISRIFPDIDLSKFKFVGIEKRNYNFGNLVLSVGKFYTNYLLKWFGNILKKNKSDLHTDVLVLNIEKNNSFLQKTIISFINRKLTTRTLILNDHIFNPKNSKVAWLSQTYPGPVKTGFFLLNRLVQYIRFNSLQRKAIKKNDFWGFVCYSEMKNTSLSINLLFYHLWLTCFFKKVKSSLKVVYEDEMYLSGRIISSAAIVANNPLVQTIAYQHGNISKSHTVYRVTDNELADSRSGIKDSLPMPDMFLVWGDYFKSQFLEWSSLYSKNIIVTGNMLYLGFSQGMNQKIKKTSPIKKILWCTTSKKFLFSEYLIIKEVVFEKDFELYVRMHPNHNIESYLKSIIPESHFSRITFDKIENIYKSLEACDLVICSGHSTVFIDAFVKNKPVIRLNNQCILNDSLSNAGVNVKNTSSKEELRVLLKTILENNIQAPSHYLYLSGYDRWEKIF